MPRSGHRPPPGQPWRAGTVAGHAHRPGGLLGLRRCPHCARRIHGARPFRIGRSAASLTLVGQPAYGQPLKPAGCLWLKAGPTCLPGSSWCRETAHLTDLKGSPSPVNGGMGGNTVRRAHGTFSSATTCCCLPYRHPTVRSCVPCPRTGLLARRAKSGPGARLPVKPWGRRDTWCPTMARQHHCARHPLSGALCCDATLVSPLTRDGEPHPGAAAGWSGFAHRLPT